MNRSVSRQRRMGNSWGIRAINVIGGIALMLSIMWETGMMSEEWWNRLTAPRAPPVLKAPAHPSTIPIGNAPLLPKGNDSSMSPMPLQLMLTRVQQGRTVTEGFADIGVVRESPQTYQVGALLENGARLVEIHSDHVLLRRNGQSARLYLNDGTRSKSGDPAIMTVGGKAEMPSPARVTSHEILTDYIRPSPVYEGEALTGYQVYSGAKAGPFSQMGLVPGDVIIALEGVSLSDPNTAWNMLRQLTDGRMLSATVKRHETVLQVNLDGQWITRSEQEAAQPATATLTPAGS